MVKKINKIKIWWGKSKNYLALIAIFFLLGEVFVFSFSSTLRWFLLVWIFLMSIALRVKGKYVLIWGLLLIPITAVFTTLGKAERAEVAAFWTYVFLIIGTLKMIREK